MELIQISDPCESKATFGIDFGTTNSLIASVDKNDNVHVFKGQDGKELLRSIVSYSNGKIKVGSDIDANTVYSIKRLLGKGLDDIKKIANKVHFNDVITDENNTIKINLGNEKYLTPIEIAANIIMALKERVEKANNYKVNKAVITVPAYFDDSARNATKYAARLAGIEVLRLINEPTAAALAYGVEKQSKSGIYAVYDLGGGTFDISILKLHNGVFQVLAVGGDVCLGGDDFDALLTKFIIDKYKRELNIEINELNIVQQNQLLIEARSAKEFLSTHENGKFLFHIDDYLFECKITRNEFEALISDLVNRTVNIVVNTIHDIDLNINEIKGVVLVGGATKVPLVKNYLSKIFADKLLSDIDPEKAVVIGAARQAHYLTSNCKEKGLLIDVLPLSLGIETIGGVVEKIILRNTPLPVLEVQEFTTYVDGQVAMTIHVCQGEREMVDQNKSLAKFELKGIPPLPAGRAKVRIKFIVDVDGILHVTAKESTTGIEQKIDINPNFGLTKDEIEDMITASVKHFNEDMQMKSLAEAKIDSKRFIEVVEEVVKYHDNLLKNSELKQIVYLLKQAKKALLGSSLDEINNITDNLKIKSSELLEKRVNKNLCSSVIGYQLEEFKDEL